MKISNLRKLCSDVWCEVCGRVAAYECVLRLRDRALGVCDQFSRIFRWFRESVPDWGTIFVLLAAHTGWAVVVVVMPWMCRVRVVHEVKYWEFPVSAVPRVTFTKKVLSFVKTDNLNHVSRHPHVVQTISNIIRILLHLSSIKFFKIRITPCTTYHATFKCSITIEILNFTKIF